MRTATILISLALAACGGGGGGFIATEPDGGTNQPASVIGSWTRGCHQLPVSGYQVTLTAMYTGSGATFSYRHYDDTGCTQSAYLVESVVNYQLSANVTLASGQEATPVDYSNLVNHVTLPSQAWVDAFNLNSYCGLSGWTVNTRRNVGTCDVGGLAITRDILRIDGDRLYTGSAAASGQYPTSLSGDYLTRS